VAQAQQRGARHALALRAGHALQRRAALGEPSADAASRGEDERDPPEPTHATLHGPGAVQQPLSATFTAAMISLIATSPSPLRSKAGQLLTGLLPRAMFTPRISSLMLTSPSPSQSPTHPPPGVT